MFTFNYVLSFIYSHKPYGCFTSPMLVSGHVHSQGHTRSYVDIPNNKAKRINVYVVVMLQLSLRFRIIFHLHAMLPIKISFIERQKENLVINYEDICRKLKVIPFHYATPRSTLNGFTFYYAQRLKFVFTFLID